MPCCYDSSAELRRQRMLDVINRSHHLPRNLLQPRNLRHDRSRFLFERPVHRLIVRLWHFAGLIFEIQISQVVVDRFLALAEIAEPRFFFSCIDLAGKEKNIVETCDRKGGTDVENHRSVSLRAFWRSASNSLPCGIMIPSASAGVGRFFHERTTKMTKVMPRPSATKGMIQATRLKPLAVGAAITVGP